jgi:uncharacterized protein YkwD
MISVNTKFPLSVVGVCLVCLLALSACSWVVSTPSPSTQTCRGASGASGATVTEVSLAKAVFKAINQDRVKQGLTPLSWCPNLANSARQHDFAMEKDGTLAGSSSHLGNTA